MVKVKQETQAQSHDGTFHISAWLKHIAEENPNVDVAVLEQACQLSELAGAHHPNEQGESCLQQGITMADILSDLDMDTATLAAAIVYESVQYTDLTLDDIREHLGERIAKLVDGVARMDALRVLHHQHTSTRAPRDHQQSDNIRKMLIAMVDNIQVVLIKLAERIYILRKANLLPRERQIMLAQETMDIYAPLANRLGIGQIKWELEDLAFRYLQPDIYKKIAQGLNAKRLARDAFVNDIVQQLTDALTQEHIAIEKIYGRSKHIYSIYRKMQRKNVDVDQIYDATAVRVLVKNVEDCYRVLSIVHQLWQRIPEEFDDYIVNPKQNGYRSLHTAVTAANDRVFEVQIRTSEMHDQAELGVAAHWLYKEGGISVEAGHERKIAWLRQVLEWQKEVTTDPHATQALNQNAEDLEDRVYVFTPAGDVADLVKGSTVLDFAYHVHSEVGHRCRGAKVDGNIVPLTYQLKTGEQISIITGKQAKPSRDWLNPQLGYLHTPRARAKVHHWFKQFDYEKNRRDGQALVERELRKQHIPLNTVNFEKVAQHSGMKSAADWFAALGNGDSRLANAIQYIQSLSPTPAAEEKEKTATAITETVVPIRVKRPVRSSATRSEFVVDGLSNVLSKAAQCCKPIPGDAIIGYLTQGQNIRYGISVHRKDCTNILKMNADQQKRLLSVHWSTQATSKYPVNLLIIAHDRYGLIRDITSIIASEDMHVLAVNTRYAAAPTVHLLFTLEIHDLHTLERLIQRIKQLVDVAEIRRVQQ